MQYIPDSKPSLWTTGDPSSIVYKLTFNMKISVACRGRLSIAHKNLSSRRIDIADQTLSFGIVTSQHCNCHMVGPLFRRQENKEKDN